MQDIQNIRLILSVNGQGIIQEVNQDYVQWTGFSKEHLVGLPVDNIRNPYPKVLIEDMSKTLTSGRAYSFYANEKKKSGESYWCEMALQPIFKDGVYGGYVAVKRILDHSEISMAEKAFSKLRSGKYVINNGVITPKWIHASFGKLMNLKTSVLTLSAAAVFLTVAVSGSLLYEEHEVSKIESKAIASHSDKILSVLDEMINKKAEIGLTNIVGIMKSDFIRKMAAEENAEELHAKLNTISDFYRENTALHNIKIHLINEEGVSYYMSWKDSQKRSDVSSRGYVVDALSVKSPKAYNAVSTSGFNIKSTLPIYNNGKYEGFSEFIQGVGSIRRNWEKQGKMYMVAISNDYIQKQPEGTRTANAKNISLQPDGSFVVGNNSQFSKEKAGGMIELLNRISMKDLISKGYLISGTHFLMSHPILDANNNVIGYHVLAESIEEFQAYLDAQTLVAKKTFWATLITLLVTVSSFLLFVFFAFLSPINKMRERIEKSTEDSDLFTRLPSYGKNELSVLAQAYNNQQMMTQYAIVETQMMLADIETGSLSRNVEYAFKSDFGILKASLNNTSKGLKETFGVIEDVMKDLQSGRFDAVHEHDLKGAYARVVDDCSASMTKLSDVFSEIGSVMESAKRGDFSKKADIDAQGQINALVETINTSMSHIEDGFGDVVQAAQRMANRDFTQPITAHYENTMDDAKQAINQSMSDLRQTMSEIIETVHLVSNEIQQVARGTEALNERTQEQAASLEETSAAMEETASQVQNNLESTKIASSIAEGKKAILNDANQTMHETQEAMNGIKEASEKIKSITSLIDSIAFQTNLLALNAAVEAARAGEHGRGFAVVAGEVRNLAGKSADAAKEISELVEKTALAIGNGVEKVDTVNGYLEKITSETERIRSVVASINSASNEQAVGISEVNNAVASIDAVTQQNAALVEQTYATVKQVNSATEELIKSVSRFKV
jgi:methyl-accepting chemotaxis protein